MNLSRRSALLGLSSVLTLGRSALALAYAPTDRRFVVIILRGGLDGLSAVQPYGDPSLTGLRGEIALAQPGQEAGLLDLGGFFGLHPALQRAHQMYAAGEFLPVHAVAGAYRTRSHFDAQDFMECGSDHRMDSGWLNRVVQVLAPSPAASKKEAIAIGVTVPLLLRGNSLVGSWGPTRIKAPPFALYQQATELAARDPAIGPALATGLQERNFLEETVGRKGLPRDAKDFSKLAAAAGEVMAASDGPRIAALEMDGFDSHGTQMPLLHLLLTRLDAGISGLKQGLGPAWRSTVVLIMTEFGRTARSNGTKGTDHGTAGVAFLAGGAVSGGRVLADWPGLGTGKLFEDRDLQPTLDLRSVAKGVLADHLGFGAQAVESVFPGSASAAPMRRLIRA